MPRMVRTVWGQFWCRLTIERAGDAGAPRRRHSRHGSRCADRGSPSRLPAFGAVRLEVAGALAQAGTRTVAKRRPMRLFLEPCWKSGTILVSRYTTGIWRARRTNHKRRATLARDRGGRSAVLRPLHNLLQAGVLGDRSDGELLSGVHDSPQGDGRACIHGARRIVTGRWSGGFADRC